MKKLFFTIFVVMIGFALFAQETTKTDFKPSGKVFGLVFGDYYYKAQGDTAQWGIGEYSETEKEYQAFGIRRVYLGYTYEISPKFSTKLTLEGNDGQLIGGSKRGVNIKIAQLKWKNIFPGSNLVVGAQSTPTWSLFTEKIWGYRSVEKTIMDYRKLGTSNDLGVSLQGKFNKSKTIGYNFMIGNGTAQKPEYNSFKKFSGSINAQLFDKKLLFEIYADYEENTDSRSITSFKGYLGYQTDNILIGLEGFQQIQSNYKSTTEDYNIGGISAYITASIIKNRLKTYIRADYYDPDYKDLDFGYNEIFALFGFDYTPYKNVHFMPNLWYCYYGSKNTKINPERVNDIVPRITFYFKF